MLTLMSSISVPSEMGCVLGYIPAERLQNGVMAGPWGLPDRHHQVCLCSDV